MRPIIKQHIVLLFGILISTGICLAQETVPTQDNLTREGVIIDGYDVVSYFLGSPSKGKTVYSETVEGVTYWFATEENQQIFKKNPGKFIPAYGGWCAYAMGESGKKVKIDPETYKIIDGKLYLFYNFYFNNTLISWNEDEVNLRLKADENWQKINKR